MTKHQPEALVALLSDLQPGLRTSTFNAEIFARRMAQWTAGVLRMQEIHSADREITTLHIAAAGDMVEGEPSSFRINLAEMDVADGKPLDVLGQKRLVQDLLMTALTTFAKRFKVVHFHGVPGNHGANRGKLASKRSNDDTEVYLNLADRLASKSNLVFDIEQDEFWRIFDVYGTRFLLVHGNQIKMWQRTPLYGIINMTTLWHRVLPQPFDTVLMGHFHNTNLVDAVGSTVYVNGCFGGDSSYEQAKGLRAVLEQWLLGVHPRYGVSWERRLWVGGGAGA